MNVSTTGKNFIKSYEKYRLDVYDDGFGFLTVGYGHKVVAADNLKEGDIITASRATTLFNADILTVETGINKHPKVSKFTQAQYDAVASLTFNAGTVYITNSNNDLYKALNKSTFVKSEVVKGFTVTIAGGSRQSGLVKRRNAELDMFYATDGMINIPMKTTDTVSQIPVSAKLTVQGTNISIRDFPDNVDGDILRKLSTGSNITATSRITVNGTPWFYIGNKSWISGDYVQGWIKDYNDNKRWWYLEKNYSYPSKTWKTISGKDYCFGKDSYLFVSCYIKSEVGNTYYWVDDDGVWLTQYNTSSPDRNKYRVVDNYKITNAYQ